MRNKRLKYDTAATALSIILVTAILTSSCWAGNETYANLPPFISSDTKANVIFVTDFSGSMSWPAHYANSSNVYQNYVSTTEYYGYFDPDEYYSYDSTNSYWYIDTGTTYSNREAGHVNSLSGNFLNFIISSRVDAVLKSLIGGKADCPSGLDYCTLQPQGTSHNVYDSSLHTQSSIWPQSGVTDVRISISDYSGTSSIGTFSNRSANVKIDAEDRHGIIQDNFSKLRLTFIAYAYPYNTTAREGLIKYGFHENDLDALVSAVQNTTPSGNTYTGEALREAYYYLTQNATAAQSYNQTYIAEGTEKDPYYEKRVDGTLEPSWCRKSFVVLISDGEWNGSVDPDTWAHNLHIDDLRETDTDPKKDKFPETQNASVYSLFAFSSSSQGEQSMKTIAAFGNYKDLTGGTDGVPYTFSESSNSKYNTFPRSNCNPSGTYNTACEEWDSKDNDGSPDAFYYASDGQAVSDALTAIFESIRQGTASGTAVTALTSRVSEGNVIAQAAFYPDKEFDDGRTVTWTGDVFSEWYYNGYIDDATGTSQLIQNIREDTNSNFELEIVSDRILEYLIENGSLSIEAFDSSAYGDKLDAIADDTYTAIEDAYNLFDCGEQLRVRDPDDRTIFGVDENDTLTAFTGSNATLFDTLLGSDTTDFPSCLLNSGTIQYTDLINYTRGEEIASCRTRKTNNLATENIWKLGDIIYSSPTIVEYQNYSMIYAGSNDGMLHAFRLGFLKNLGNPLHPARLCDDNSASTCTHTSLGKEEWAFVPKDSMPYLRYMADPDYDHMYSVDLKPYIVDTGAQKILIGGMRMGGATDATGAGAINPPYDTGTIGRSAYYALDITDPLNPKYLWRYAPDGLGFTYSGPAYIKRKDTNGNWQYFILFASGPTGYEGTSTQDLKIFIVDLFTGAELDVFGDQVSEMNMNNAFGGRLFTNGLDVNEDGQTDFIFLGYTNVADGPYNKMQGGMIKIHTGSHDPTKWDYDTTFLSFASNPITAPIKAMRCFPDQIPFPFLYFGTGRYFVSNDQTQDGTNDINYLYGVPFIYDADNNRITGGAGISSSSNASSLTCDSLDAITTNPQQAAWNIPLEAAGGSYLRERCYSDPTTTEFNVVFFDTAQPTDVVCECGGRARSWVVNCATGMGLADVLCSDVGEDSSKYMVDSSIKFKYLVQLSGGDIQQHEKGEFDQNVNRTTDWQEGVPAEQGGLPTFPPGSMVGQILYWKQW